MKIMAQEIIEIAQSYVYTIVIGIIILLIGFGIGILAKKLAHKICLISSGLFKID